MSPSSSTIHSIATNCKDSSPVNLPYLPDDLLLNCLARVSRLYYPTLSLVSRKFCSLVASKELYETRKLLGCTESCLYICDHTNRWFTLRRRPTRIPSPNHNKSSDNVMVVFPTSNYSHMHWTNAIAVGFSIYMIGGYYNYEDEPLSKVFFLDCRSHTWCEAPSMQVAREYPRVCVLDGKIYVVGGFKDYNSSNWMECFDPKTQKWEYVPTHVEDLLKRDTYNGFAIIENIYLIRYNDTLVYKPKENSWEAVELETELGWDARLNYKAYLFCVIDNISYRYVSANKLQWYDSAKTSWRVLTGVEELSVMLPDPYHVSLV